MESIAIRRTTPGEVEQLQEISRRTFLETFSSANTAENMRKYLEEGFSVDKLSDELKDPNTQFYFAALNKNVIGYLKLNFGDSQTEMQDDRSVEIERIYVLKDFHGKNVGQLLYEKAIEIAKLNDADYVWLGVWEENSRAIAFYKKNGFVAFDKHVFKLGDDEQIDIMMKLPLKNNLRLNTQSVLENDKVVLYPLVEEDFEALYSVASNPEIWKQHPNKDRWKKDVFRTFFEGAIQSKGAYKIIDKSTGKIAGSTRIYDYDEKDSSVLIGYTFYGTEYWGTGMNHAVKALMLDYLFQFVSQVFFQIGADNIRSQISISRLGAKKVEEQEIAYFGEAPKLNFIYRIGKADWLERNTTNF